MSEIALQSALVDAKFDGSALVEEDGLRGMISLRADLSAAAVKKAVKPKSPQSPDLEEAIRVALVEKKLSCRAAWDIAQRFDVPKMAVSAACEALEIKIKPCQLGAF